MEYLDRLTIKGFRRLEQVVDLDLRPLTVVIGPNGAGKTSLLDAFVLLARSAAGKLKESITEAGGLASILTRDRADALVLQVIAPVVDYAPIQYHLELAPSGQSYMVANEVLGQQLDPHRPAPFKHIDAQGGDVRYFESDSRTLVRPNWKYDYLETALSQVPKLYRQCESFRERLASLARYAARDFDLSARSAARSPQPMRPAELPGPKGEDLIPCLYYLRETDRCRFDQVVDSVRAAFPDLERFDFPPVAAATLAITWKDRGFAKPLYAHELSDGTLRFLWLVTLLHSPGLTSLTLIDEPEASLHPDMLRILADLLREAAERTQLVVATHSERLVRFLKPQEVLVLDVDNAQAVPRWADTLDLDSWLQEYALDELWRMNRLGGNP